MALGEAEKNKPITEPVIWDKFSSLNQESEIECSDDEDEYEEEDEEEPYSDDFDDEYVE